MARKAQPASGYRVDLKLVTGEWIEYTSLRVPVTLEMAEALGRGLQRQHAAGRIVAVPSGDVVKEWGTA